MDANKLGRNAYRVMEAAARMAEKLGSREVSSRIEEINICTSGYAEPGYDGEVVATGNWNKVDRWDSVMRQRLPVPGSDLVSRVGEILERIGVEIEWSDEWTDCHDCGKLVRTQPNSYSWQPSYAIVSECEIVCHECLQNKAEEYLAGLEGKPHTCNAIEDIDPADHGYVKVGDDHSTGWHPGQNDDPKAIAEELESRGITRFLFNLDGNEQFAQHWSVYVHESEAAMLDNAPQDEVEVGDRDDDDEDSSDE